MNQALLDTLRKRKDRMAAIILSSWESDSQDFRKVVLDQVNDYHDLVINLMKVVDDSSVILNETYLAKIEDIYEKVVDA